jgi:O-antigen/teichoic acid export membrane protein
MKSDAQKKESAAEMPIGNVGGNLMWMVWSGAISIANSIVLWVFIARMRDVEELGRFTIVMGLYALFYNICSLGLIPFFVSEISRRINVAEETAAPAAAAAGVPAVNEQRLADFISSASVFLLISGFVCAASMAVCGFLVSQSWGVRIPMLILSLAMIPTGVINVAEATAIACGRTRLIAYVSTLENVLRTVVPFALIWFGFDIAWICAAFVGVRIVALSAYLWTARRGGGGRRHRRLSRFSFSKIDFVKILKV